MASNEPTQLGLVVRAEKERKPDTRPRINGVLAHRAERIRAVLDRQLLRDAGTVGLSRFAMLDDTELSAARLNGRPLTNQEKRIARAWEMSRRDAPVSIQAAHDRLTAILRMQAGDKGISINVERAVIRVPDTKPDDAEESIVIDVEATSASR